MIYCFVNGHSAQSVCQSSFGFCLSYLTNLIWLGLSLLFVLKPFSLNTSCIFRSETSNPIVLNLSHILWQPHLCLRHSSVINWINLGFKLSFFLPFGFGCKPP